MYHIKIFIKNNIHNCHGLFHKCENLLNIDLSSFDTKNATDMSYMFYGCKSLKNINLSSFDTKNVTDMWGMFSCCKKLKNSPNFHYNKNDSKILNRIESTYWG